MARELRFPRINNITISGRLTRDVDLRYTPSGTPVAKISIAFDRRYQKNGNWETETSYIDVISWDQKATYYAENLVKGTAVLIEGRLQVRTYTNNEGKNVKISEIVSNRIHILEWLDNKKSDFEDKHFENMNAGSSYSSDEKSVPAKKDETTEDDVPF